MTEKTCNQCGRVLVKRTETTLRFTSSADMYYYAESSTWAGICKCGKGYRISWAECIKPTSTALDKNGCFVLG